DLQHAVHRSLVARNDAELASHIIPDGLAPQSRLNIYRNTFVGTLTTALRLSFPAVYRLVGAAFFESAARIFIEAEPPDSAYLDDYGETFPDFLARFAPAASLSYLPDVARLEWCVNRALHALDVEPLDLARLAAIDPQDQSRVGFVPCPSIGLVRSTYPVDAIWRAVLAQDDDAMSKIDLRSDPVWLLIERRKSGVDVIRCTAQAWRFASELFATRPLEAAIDAAPGVDASILLADHLAAGRLVDFKFVDLAGANAPEVNP
ncbi:MAG TPA: DNA-binding domain-containing protein, partial [Stellaceae bacterium]|nr:DNA-binding domain-containing protein [Stellaceae bacterium]